LCTIAVVRYTDSEDYRNDSAFSACDREKRIPYTRSIVPSDPALVFPSELIDDFRDESNVRIAFHLR